LANLADFYALKGFTFEGRNIFYMWVIPMLISIMLQDGNHHSEGTIETIA